MMHLTIEVRFPAESSQPAKTGSMQWLPTIGMEVVKGAIAVAVAVLVAYLSVGA